MAGSRVGTCEGTVRLLQTDGDCLPVLQTDDPIVVGVCWSPDAKLIAAAGNQGQVTIWDRSWKRVQEFRCDSPLSSIDWSPDGTKLLMADHNHGLQILDYRRGACADDRDSGGAK